MDREFLLGFVWDKSSRSIFPADILLVIQSIKHTEGSCKIQKVTTMEKLTNYFSNHKNTPNNDNV